MSKTMFASWPSRWSRTSLSSLISTWKKMFGKHSQDAVSDSAQSIAALGDSNSLLFANLPRKRWHGLQITSEVSSMTKLTHISEVRSQIACRRCASPGVFITQNVFGHTYERCGLCRFTYGSRLKFATPGISKKKVPYRPDPLCYVGCTCFYCWPDE